MSAQPRWRGYINMIIYGVDLTRPVPLHGVADVAESLIQERSYTKPPSVYYSAATEALDSAGQLEQNTRDFLRQLVDELDRRRPWVDQPFLFRDSREWGRLDFSTTIGRIPLANDEIRRHLGRGLDPTTIDHQVELALILQLRTGQAIGIHSALSHAPGPPEVVTAAEPDRAISDFRELTGLPLSAI